MSSDAVGRSFDSVPKLLGKENFVIWKTRITVALSLTKARAFIREDAAPPYPSLPSLPDQIKANSDWHDRDNQIAGGILGSCDESILSAYAHLLEEDGKQAATVWKELCKVYGDKGAQSTFALGRKFIDMKCGEGEDVEAWVNKVLAMHRELKVLKFDLEALGVNVLLNGLPDQFSAYIDSVWSETDTPSTDDVKIAILRINAGHHHRNGEAGLLAARMASTHLVPPSEATSATTTTVPFDTSLVAFYTGLHRSGKRPSKEHPCSRCGSIVHWVIDCPHPPQEGHGGTKGWKGQKKRGKNRAGQANVAATKDATKEIAAFAGGAVSVFGGDEHVLCVQGVLAVDERSACNLVSKMDVTSASCKGHSDDVTLLTRSTVTSAAGQLSDAGWVLDSGASETMTGNAALLESLLPLERPLQIVTAGGSQLVAQQFGVANVVNHLGERVKLQRVLLVPGLAFNLLSVSHLITAGASVEFKKGRCDIIKNGRVALVARLTNKAWMVATSPTTTKPDSRLASLACALKTLPATLVPNPSGRTPAGIYPSSSKATWSVWHRRLAHLSTASMRKLFGALSTGSSIARATDDNQSTEVCNGCAVGKIVRPPFPAREKSAEGLLDLVHSDLCDISRSSEGGARHVMVLVDDHSRYTWVYFLAHKSDALKCFKAWLPLAERTTGRSLKVFRSDNGGEYTGHDFERYLQELGIQHQTTVPYTSQQNGVAERTNRTIVERTVALLHSEQLPIQLWAEVMQTVVYLKNRSPAAALPDATPYERMFGSKPSLAHLRVVGCPGWVLIHKKKRENKLAVRAELCCMLGYSETQKAWRLWNPATKRMVVSRDVIFDESKSWQDQHRLPVPVNELHALLPVDRDTHQPSSVAPTTAPMPRPAYHQFAEAVGDGDEGSHDGTPLLPHHNDAVGAEDLPEEVGDEQQGHVLPVHGSFGRHRGSWQMEPHSVNPTPPQELPDHQTRSGKSYRGQATFATAIPPQISYEDELHDFLGRPGEPDYHPSDPRLPGWPTSLSPVALATWAEVLDDPKSWDEAMSSPYAANWQEAAKEEMGSLVAAGVFKLVPRSEAGGRVVTSKWVFKTKHQADGSLDKHKARVVARGFTQREGVDYGETFAPVAKFQSIRVILALAAMFNLELHQMDVKTAFLYGVLDELVYMEQPEGFREKDNMVWLLKKALYGLKQSPRAWYRNLDSTLVLQGFIRLKSDHSIYVRQDHRGLIIVGVYVDDLTIAASNLDLMTEFKSVMATKYEMKDLGELHFILGLQVERDRTKRTLRLCQQHYIDTVLQRFGFNNCKPASTPLPPKQVLFKRKPGAPAADRNLYLSAVGSLMYAMLGTRPDLAFAVGMLGRFASDPSEEHWTAVTHVFRYLQHTHNLGITYHPDHGSLEGYSDSDHGTSDPDSRRCTSGYVFTLWGGAVSWQSKRQPAVSIATADAEYVALSQAAREIVWLRSLLMELGYPVKSTVRLYGDNQASIALAENPTGHTRSKQIDIRYHYLRELVEQAIIAVKYTPTATMIADGLTKSLPPLHMARFLSCFGLTAPSAPMPTASTRLGSSTTIKKGTTTDVATYATALAMLPFTGSPLQELSPSRSPSEGESQLQAAHPARGPHTRRGTCSLLGFQSASKWFSGNRRAVDGSSKAPLPKRLFSVPLGREIAETRQNTVKLRQFIVPRQDSIALIVLTRFQQFLQVHSPAMPPKRSQSVRTNLRASLAPYSSQNRQQNRQMSLPPFSQSAISAETERKRLRADGIEKNGAIAEPGCETCYKSDATCYILPKDGPAACSRCVGSGKDAMCSINRIKQPENFNLQKLFAQDITSDIPDSFRATGNDAGKAQVEDLGEVLENDDGKGLEMAMEELLEAAEEIKDAEKEREKEREKATKQKRTTRSKAAGSDSAPASDAEQHFNRLAAFGIIATSLESVNQAINDVEPAILAGNRALEHLKGLQDLLQRNHNALRFHLFPTST